MCAQVKLLMMNLISRVIATHDLLVLSFYPFVQAPAPLPLRHLAIILRACTFLADTSLPEVLASFIDHYLTYRFLSTHALTSFIHHSHPVLTSLNTTLPQVQTWPIHRYHPVLTLPVRHYQKYMQPHQPKVTSILAFAAQVRPQPQSKASQKCF